MVWSVVWPIFGIFWYIFSGPFALLGGLSVCLYLALVVLQVLVFDNFPVNLKKKYKAEWALVTGASSGIGKAIVEKLCSQGLNVVLVAYPDAMLDATFKELSARFPALTLRKVAADLSRPGYMEPIVASTVDISVGLLFNNAGFITAGPFVDTPIERSLGNLECNATCTLPITHHFVKKLLASHTPGFVGFTSSSAGFVPNPLSCLYSSTKAFMTLFATSLAAEIRSQGIDVVVVHPSPMATNFFDNAGKLGTLLAFKKFAAGPSVIADVMFNSAGRFVVRDQGLVSIAFRLLLKAVDLNFFCELTARCAHLTGDFKVYQADAAAKKST